MRGDEPGPEEEKVPTSVEPDVIVIEKVKGVAQSPSPSLTTSSLCKAGGMTRFVGQSLMVAAAPSVNTMTAGKL